MKPSFLAKGLRFTFLSSGAFFSDLEAQTVTVFPQEHPQAVTNPGMGNRVGANGGAGDINNKVYMTKAAKMYIPWIAAEKSRTEDLTDLIKATEDSFLYAPANNYKMTPRIFVHQFQPVEAIADYLKPWDYNSERTRDDVLRIIRKMPAMHSDFELSANFHDFSNYTTSPLFSRLRADHRLFLRPSPQKQISSNNFTGVIGFSPVDRDAAGGGPQHPFIEPSIKCIKFKPTKELTMKSNQTKPESVGSTTWICMLPPTVSSHRWLPAHASWSPSFARPFHRTKASPCHVFRHDRGFTLVELLVVIAIVAVLAVVGFTASRKMILNANKTRSMNNLRQLVTASQSFSSENNGVILHETATMINDRRRVWTDVLLDELAPEAASLDQKQRDMIAKNMGLFGDNQALKVASAKLPKSGSGSWRTFAYNNQIGAVTLDPGQTMGWVAGAAFTHQVENPQKLILFSHAKLNSKNVYTYILQRNDYNRDAIEFDIYGGSGIVGFFDGHVEMFQKANFPGPGARNPQTGSPYTDAELNQYYWGRATRIPRS